ncbi:hypothetical protein GW17_00016222 [Ensete ventricosum]|uniref:Uncharacterized protein n=1 Tax=Ensete ventricosum TaxID=4639 RepID=A0A427BCL6_ENSVE|nr:hypothetical protein B296_00002687 [Ensete ventricosum]RWW19699.1 hypothetical protein GW17_00016222 [Ensete ventricosum]RZS05460.1 hypothetical protein BHM03_00035988 [Ensete ventricosum]
MAPSQATRHGPEPDWGFSNKSESARDMGHVSSYFSRQASSPAQRSPKETSTQKSPSLAPSPPKQTPLPNLLPALRLLLLPPEAALFRIPSPISPAANPRLLEFFPSQTPLLRSPGF